MALKVKTYNNVQANVTFSKASSRVEINPTAGEAATENIALTLGKISKWYDSLVPTGGSSGKILVYNSSGTAKWNDPLHPTITKSADTTSTASPAHGGTFTTVDSVTRDANGHVTKINTKTVTLPSDQNTDTKVTQTNTTTSADYRILFSENANDTTETVGARKNTGLKYNPNSGMLYAPRITLKSATVPAINVDLDTLKPTAGQNVNILGVSFKNADGSATHTTYPIGIIGNDATGAEATYNSGVRLGSTSGITIVAAGESSTSFASAQTKYNEEQLYLVSDGGIFMYTNMSNEGALGYGPWRVSGFTTNPSSGQVVITDGTAGGIKSSGYTIATSVPSGAVFTDTKVTSSANHYTPATASGSDKTASASGATAAWGIDVVKGITINTDGKGHITGLSVTSGKIPGNPDTDTKVTQTAVGSTYTNYRPLVISASNADSAPPTATTVTDGTFITSSIYCQPSSGSVYATKFIGPLQGNADTATKLGTANKGSVTKGIYLNDGAPQEMTYSLGATVNAGTVNKLAYYSGANAISPTPQVGYYEINSTASTPVSRKILDIRGAAVGNTAAELISGTAGLLTYGDGGPQINFGTSATMSASGAQEGALIYTDHDSAAAGVSWHFVSNQTDWNVTSKRFHARTSISIGSNLPSTSYNLTVKGTSYFDNTITIKGTSSGNASIYYASYGNTRNTPSIRFYDGDVNGQGIQVGGGGLTVIGGGESAQAVFDNLSTLGWNASSEVAVVASDGPIYFMTNTDTFANRKSINIDTSGYLNTGYINMNVSDQDNLFTSASSVIYSTSDKYLRRVSLTKLGSILGPYVGPYVTNVNDGNVIHQNDYKSDGFTRPVHRFIRDLRTNKLAFTLPGNIAIEYSTDGGSNWVNFGYTDAEKAGPFLSRHFGGAIAIGPASSAERTTSMQTRITITNDGRDCMIDQFYIWMSTSGHGTVLDIQYTTQSAKTTWVNWRTNVSVAGWSGPNIINVSELRYGNTLYQIRFIFKITSIHADYKTSCGTIYDIQAYGGMGCWTDKNNMMKHDSLYTWDYEQKVTFPAEVKVPGQLRVYGGNYGTLLRNDGTNTYFLLTASGSAESGTWNSLRPFYFSNSTGYVTMSHGVTIASSSYGALSIVRSGSTNNAGIKFYNNGSTYLGSLALGTANGTFVRFKTDESTSYEIIDRSVVTATPTAVVSTNFSTAAERTLVTTKGWISYWDGSYDSTSHASNLTYCNKGAFGSIVTKAADYYLPISGGAMTGLISSSRYTNCWIALGTANYTNDTAGLSSRNDVDICTWYGFSVSNGNSGGIGSGKVAFSVDARTGQTYAYAGSYASTFATNSFAAGNTGAKITTTGLQLKTYIKCADTNQTVFTYTSDAIRTYDGKISSNDGILVAVGGGGLTILGSGESANALAGLISDDQKAGTPSKLNIGGTLNTSYVGNSEQAIVSSDENIYFITNCQTIANRKPVCLDTSLNFYPGTTNTGSVGTSSYKWNAMYATTFYGALSGNASTASYLVDSVSSSYTLRYINSNDTTTWTSATLAATDSIAVIRGDVTGAWRTGHIVTFNVKSVGTPFQLGVHDSNELYFYKRYRTASSPETWSDWTKMNAGTADNVAWSGVTSKPTTLSGYGITDAKISSGTITLGSNTITPLTSHQSVSDKNVTLAWGTQKTIATIGSTDIHVTLPSNPNTNTTYTLGTSTDTTVTPNEDTVTLTPSSGSVQTIKVPYAKRAKYVYTDSIGSGAASHAAALQTYFNANKNSINRNSVLGYYSNAESNGSICMGYFLNGYNDTPYGGFFVAHYNTPKYVGISNGTFTQHILLSNQNYTDYTVKKDGTGATGDWDINITGSAASATMLNHKTLDATTLNNTAGSFAFSGGGEPWSGTDWVGLQIGDNSDKFQITASSNCVLFRQNDSGGTNTTNWGDWIYLGALKSANGYWGLASPSGDDSAWIRTSSQGIIPYQSGNAGSGHNYLGTSTWYFAHAYIDTIHAGKTIFGRLCQKTDTTRQTTANLACEGTGTMQLIWATGSMTTGKPVSDGFILDFDWDNTGSYKAQLFVPNSGASTMQWRGQTGSSDWSGANSGWRTLIDSNNISNQSVNSSTYVKVVAKNEVRFLNETGQFDYTSPYQFWFGYTWAAGSISGTHLISTYLMGNCSGSGSGDNLASVTAKAFVTKTTSGGSGCSMQYNSSTQSLDFVFA